MRTQTQLRTLFLLLVTALLAVAGACSTDSPTQPERPPATPPGGGGGGGTTAFSVTVTASPSAVTAGSDDPVVITVRAVRSDNGQPAPNGTLAVVSALEGSFGEPGGPSSVTVELTNGVAQVAFFPPVDEEGTVVVRASVAGNVGQTTVEVQGTATFFVSHVAPSTGSPQGGESVAIIGNGFEQPVRVLFGSVNAQVLSVSPTRIVVRTPPSPGATNATTTVAVTVTINLNEEEEASDTVAGAFTFAPGGGEVRQPTVFSVTPTTGPNEGGTPVSIIGEGFQAPVQVLFCNPQTGDCVEAAVQSVTSNRIEVRSPAATGFGSALRDSSATIRITNLGSGLTTERADAFRFGVQLQVTGLTPDTVDAENPALVTVFGSGFESPLSVLLGDRQQQVISVTGTQVVFRPAPLDIVGCPAPGAIVSSQQVTVRLLSSGASGSSPVNLKFTADVPRPQIQGLSPNIGPSGGGTLVNINGSGFDDPVRVLFGGNQANVTSVTPTQVRVTAPPFTGTFPTEACTTGDGVPGTRQRPVSVNVTVTNLDTGCSDTASGAFTYQPPATCVPNEAPPAEDPECDDGVDNDGDGDVDFPDDAECTDANDDDESA
jgi:hypothetical protein